VVGWLVNTMQPLNFFPLMYACCLPCNGLDNFHSPLDAAANSRPRKERGVAKTSIEKNLKVVFFNV